MVVSQLDYMLTNEGMSEHLRGVLTTYVPLIPCVLFLTGNGLKIHRTDSLPPYDMQAGTVSERDGFLCGGWRVTGRLWMTGNDGSGVSAANGAVFLAAIAQFAMFALPAVLYAASHFTRMASAGERGLHIQAPRESAIRCCTQLSTSLLYQREHRPSLMGFGNLSS